MGTYYIFFCVRCAYSMIVAGGISKGFHAVTETMI